MKTLIDQYEELIPGTSVDDALSVQFIQQKLFLYGKGYLDVTKLLEKIPSDRIKHIVSMFLMGLLLYKKTSAVRDSMNEFIEKWMHFPSDGHTKEEQFEFLWMLTAFYHDVGYAYENERMVCTSYAHQLSSYRYPVRRNRSYIPNCYDDELLNSYAWYRYQTSGKCDHGIAGAQKFYEDISKANPQGRRKLRYVYRAVCLCIACHNVWFPDDDTIGVYKAFGLHRLVDTYKNAPYKKVRAINLEQHPLLFLLSLADNIEPFKRSKSLAILDRVRMKFDRDLIEIKLNGINAEQSYFKSIVGLDEWLVDVINERRTIIIKLNNTTDNLEKHETLF